MVSKLDHATAAAHQNAAPPLNCPRCDSANTKFCYYNNYSLAQPRHFCKSCKRYWTRGGTLRNVPVGGSCRKNKRAKKSHHASVSATAAASTALPLPSIIRSPAADLNSLLFGFPPHMMNSSTAFFPKFELDAPHARYEETFSSAPAQADFLGDYSMMNPQIPSSSPLMSYDDLNVAKERETNFSFAASGGAVGQSYLYWNQAMSGGWPESGSSVAPLI